MKLVKWYAYGRRAWDVSVDPRDPTKLCFCEQQRDSYYKNSVRRFKTTDAAWAAMWELFDERLAQGWDYRNKDEKKKFEAVRAAGPSGAKPAKRPEPIDKPSKAWPSTRAKRPAWFSRVAKEVASIERAIAKAKLSHRSADILSLARPAIRFKLTKAAKAKPATTRFGGSPDVPAGFKWPMRGKTPLAFVAQFRCEELAKFDLEKKLPARGLISIFAFLLPEEGYGEHAAAFYFPDAARLAPLAPPHDADDDGRPAKMAIATPSLKVTLAHPESDIADTLRLSDEESERYHDDVWLATLGVRDDVSGPGTHQLLGWPDQMDEHAFEKGWELLAQIDSDDRFGLELGDVETLRVHIASKKLAVRSFDNVRSALGGE